MKKFFIIYFFVISYIFANQSSVCQLYNPDSLIEDVFSGSDGYKVDFSVDGFAFYNIYKDNKIVGYALCNKEFYLTTQFVEIVVVYDADKKLKHFFFQQIHKKNGMAFNNKNFISQFHPNVNSGTIKNPDYENRKLFNAIIRAFNTNKITMIRYQK
ncbi:MAG: hypothetical protein Ta2D_12740 [Rickettsiales bacterium]|nr:MAG: hypothetical protein Ta2D_12740 [Rickettsiales bacterium]